ncbi:hypothetical protein PsorP6_011297 [Peronosclerospora sorghi]|uniref:Uncharacterized protein n=1 Tax=Peronosclerospora sorghi TaxID=230839 RepID=A0ACC0WLB1_9STRA|nr:hypothetical protein PsorP6_011297 [Peronosclerospora sorghi]
MDQMVRPTVGDALVGEIMPPVVNIDTLVARAAKLMANTKNMANVLSDEQELCGMVTTKDLIRKLVAKGLYAETTTVKEVMTVDPDLMGPNVSIVDGLRSLHDAGQLFMPILAHDGEILGMDDVICLDRRSCRGGWRANNFWGRGLRSRKLSLSRSDRYVALESNCCLESLLTHQFRTLAENTSLVSAENGVIMEKVAFGFAVCASRTYCLLMKMS